MTKIERWKPEKGDLYFFVSTVGDVFPDRADSDFASFNGRFGFGNYFRSRSEAQAAAKKIKELLLGLQDDIQDKQFPKLTAEVFARPDCPDWAKWAALDENGDAYYYKEKPFPDNFHWNAVGTNWQYIYCRFDPSDWKNSLIERPANLPDWCKVGEWCYCLDDDGNGKYFKITKLKDNYIYGEDWDIDYHFIRQARLRPYNADEMKALVGKVICTIEDKTFVVLAYANNMVLFGDILHTAEDLTLDRYNFQDGSPCGKLEHLENGEWVE